MTVVNLRWTKHETWWEAKLGAPSKGDGVTFTVQHWPTCHRRGPYVLTVEVASGQGHELWGCFDSQDQPVRYYHVLDSLLDESDALAAVLWSGRLERGDPPPSDHETEELEPPSKVYVACSLHVRTCESCSEVSVSPDALLASTALDLVAQQRDELDEKISSIYELWHSFRGQHDLDRLEGFEELAAAIEEST